MSVAPGAVVVGGVGDGLVDGVGSGRTGRGGVRDVVVGVRSVGGAKLGSGCEGSGATMVSCWELLTITNAMTRPITVTTATPATTHSHRGDLGPSGSGGSPPWPGG